MMACQPTCLLPMAGLYWNVAIALSVDEHHMAMSVADVLQADQLASQTALHTMVTHMMENDFKKTRMGEIMHKLSGHVNLKSAGHRMSQKHLPPDVMALVNEAAESDEHHKTRGEFDESSLTKAREVLNDMVQSAQAELDAKIIDCQTYKEANRGTYDQIEKDLSRIAAEISDLERLKLEANNGITKAKEDILAAKAAFKKATMEYMQQLAIDEADMRVKQNDLDVFQFILEFTKCESDTTEAGLLQEGHGHHHVNICEAHDHLVINFNNKALQEKYERMMTPTARREIAKVLGEVQLQARPASLLQVAEEPEDGPPKSTTFAPIMSATVPVLEGENAKKGQLKCPPTPPDCGLLHDKMSLMWGVYKDQVDQ